MNDIAIPGTYCVVTEPATLTIQRLLPGPAERIWPYLVDGELRRLWLADGAMEMKVGADFELVWRNDELSGTPSHRPDGFPEEQRMRSRITGVDSCRRLSFAWQGSGDVSFALEPVGEEVLLTVVHRSLPDRATLLAISAGWHMHLDILVARATGRAPQAFWEGWTRLRQEYERRLPA
jgi:uncharacterized protein YndB with AHSA1/START domain